MIDEDSSAAAQRWFAEVAEDGNQLYWKLLDPDFRWRLTRTYLEEAGLRLPGGTPSSDTLDLLALADEPDGSEVERELWRTYVENQRRTLRLITGPDTPRIWTQGIPHSAAAPEYEYVISVDDFREWPGDPPDLGVVGTTILYMRLVEDEWRVTGVGDPPPGVPRPVVTVVHTPTGGIDHLPPRG